jgi:YQGE family putative transporter
MRQMLSREVAHFGALNQRAQSLLVSFVSYNIAAPLLTLFCNAYIWRQKQELMHVALYNGSWMIGLALVFVANGFALRHVALKWLYALGLVLQSASCAVLFAVRDLNVVNLIALGFFSGSMAALYWANRNLLSLQMTCGSERDYFCSLESALGMLLSVVSPVAFGWFLQLGTNFEEDLVVYRYQILTAFTVVIQLAGAWYIVRTPFDDYSPQRILVSQASLFWNRARLFVALKGVAEGSALFLPTLIVLRLLGQEGALGTLQSLATLGTTALLYGIARWMRGERRTLVLASGLGVMLLGGLALSLWYSPFGGVIYLLLQTLGIQLIWAAANPIMLDAINADQRGDGDSYRYVVDRELFLNVGRMVGVFLVLGSNIFFDDNITLRVAPVILALVTSAMLLCSRDLTRTRHASYGHSAFSDAK